MENRVAGRVLVDGTGRGIRDLLLVLYDLDPQKSPQGVGDSPDDSIEALVASPWSRFWIDFPGDRIGSVLSDRNGRFELTFDDSAFRVRNTEKRPDLMLLVLAPERARAPTVQSQLLHYTLVPYANAGRIEHFVVAIPTDALRRAGVFLAAQDEDPDGMAELSRRELLQAKAGQEKTTGLIRAQLALDPSRRERRRIFQHSLPSRLLQTTLPAAARYVERGAPPADVHRDAVVAGVLRLAEAHTPNLIAFNLPPDLIVRLGLNPERLLAGETSTVSLCDLLAQKALGGELTRVRRLLDDKRAHDLAAGAVEPRPPTPPTTSPPEPLDTSVVSAFLAERVLGQVASLPPLQQAQSASTIEELRKIKETISKLELSGGPANVTAFHDFHTLQLAFEDVWTAAFDSRLREQVLDLYRQTVRLHEDYGLEVPPLEAVADANALREYLADLRGELAEMEILTIPVDIQRCFPQLDLRTWNQLDVDGQNTLRTTAANYLRPWDTGNDIDPPVSLWTSQEYLDRSYADVLRYHRTAPLAQTDRLLVDIAERLNQPYAFRFFAPGTINYGILVTYRQEWTPETYQVGRLVSTIPLAPGETRKLKVTRTVKKTRAEKAIEKALVESSSERQFTSRTELDVMAKVMSSTNFRLSATGSFNIGIGEISSTTEFAANQSSESTQQKKQMLEAVQKAAERVRQESEVSVESSDSLESGYESDTELKNPNSELTVTYLLYELERRYRVNSRPHKLTPVVLVAVDVPAPHEITEGWILEHAWILRRILLDDGFQEALAYVEDGLSGDLVDLEIKKSTWEAQRRLLGQLESDLERLLALRDQRQASIVSLLQGEGLAAADQPNDGARAAAAIFSGGLSELFGIGATHTDERLRAQREAAEKALDFLKARIESLSERASLAQKALSDATAEYSRAVRTKSQKDTQIHQLKLHLRQNILHYLHGILDYRHQDQQFVELNDLQVPFLRSATRNCTLRRATPGEIEAGVPGLRRHGETYVVHCDPPVPPSTTEPLPSRRLGSVADLNRPLGYKGNYVIYPLKGCSHLTDYMSRDYVDDYFGLRDPATRLGYTGEELLAYAQAVLNDPAAALSEAERTALIAAVAAELSNPAAGRETVILPTGQLYMEALKGEQTLLESFKLAHRGLDVLKVQEEVRSQRLENLRRASRLVAETPNLDDPDIDRVIVVRGGDGVNLPIEGDR